MDEADAWTRRFLLGAAGAVSLVGGLWASGARVARAATADGASAAPDAPRTRFCFEARVNIGPAITIGQSSNGLKRLIPITGGSFAGPRIQGDVIPGGGDYQLVRPDGVTSVEARYTLRASDGALIYIANRGIIVPAADEGKKGGAYVRTAPEFEAPTGPHDWLNKALFLGLLDGSQFAAGRIIVRVFEVV